MLTRREKEVLQLVTTTTHAHGKTPSYRKLMQLLGLSSPATIYKHIKNLKKKGYLEKSPDARYTSIKEPPVTQIAVVGSISHEKKIALFSQVSNALFEYGDTSYGFVVEDNSFSELSILQGDLLVVQVAHSPRLGDRVLATNKEGLPFIGTLMQQDDLECISCQNSFFIMSSQMHITGVVKAVIRTYNSSCNSSCSSSSGS